MEPAPSSASPVASQLGDDDPAEQLKEELRGMVSDHLALIGLPDTPTSVNGNSSKELIRASHAAQRVERASIESEIVWRSGQRMLEHFADGKDVDVAAIEPVIVPVRADTAESRLFRLATLLWSVPVSRGYGRRLRFLVRDRTNGKVIGILALGSPVFNLRKRDDWIGWTTRDREDRLINVMDAFVVGAVPPYSQLIGGKLVAALIGSDEVSHHFEQEYGNRRGIISGRVQSARLVLATTTSALGRSSLYNRLRLPGVITFERIGHTEGWGHFHISEPIFQKMRELLSLCGHTYASGHQFGQGPNWRMRVIRVGLELIGLHPDGVRHGIQREIFAAPLAENWREFLLGKAPEPVLHRPSAAKIGRACVERWMLPRAERTPEFRDWTREDTWHLLTRDLERQGQVPVAPRPLL